MSTTSFNEEEIARAAGIVQRQMERNEIHADYGEINDFSADADEHRADLREQGDEDLDLGLDLLRKVSRFTPYSGPEPVQLTERQVKRLEMTIVNYEFRWQVERPDAAQRAADDLAIILPILRQLVNMPEVGK